MSSKRHVESMFFLGRLAKIFYNGRMFTGTIVDETRNTLTLKTAKNTKTFPKQNIVLHIITADAYEFKIKGPRIVGRPVERLLKAMKK